jgi:hypothetical protein
VSADTRAAYACLAALSDRYAAHGERAGQAPAPDLAPHELRVFSQNGEDGVVEEILRRVGTRGGTFVEFGAGAGGEGNCVFLAAVLGWEGLLMEADPDLFARLDARYEGHRGVRTVRARVGPENVNALLADHAPSREPDVLSIDVDGIDYWIWRALEVARPRVVVIEYNAHLGPDDALVQPLDPRVDWDGSDHFGASLAALRGLGARKGYRLVHTDLAGVNAFFVREDLAGPFGPEDAVPARAPNYFLAGEGHPPHEGDRAYVTPPP